MKNNKLIINPWTLKKLLLNTSSLSLWPKYIVFLLLQLIIFFFNFIFKLQNIFFFSHGWLVIQWSWFKFINGSMSRETKRFYTTLIEDPPRKEATLMHHKIWMHPSKNVVSNFVHNLNF